jgi:hypothetical protein
VMESWFSTVKSEEAHDSRSLCRSRGEVCPGGEASYPTFQKTTTRWLPGSAFHAICCRGLGFHTQSDLEYLEGDQLPDARFLRPSTGPAPHRRTALKRNIAPAPDVQLAVRAICQRSCLIA